MKKRKRGRPRIKNPRADLTIKLPPILLRMLKADAKRSGVPISRRVEALFSTPAKKRKGPLTAPRASGKGVKTRAKTKPGRKTKTK